MFSLEVSAEGFRPRLLKVEPQGGTADLGTVMLDPGHTLDVVVRHPNGEPLSDAHVGALFAIEGGAAPPAAGDWRVMDFVPREPGDRRRLHELDVRTDAQGRVRLRGLPPGEVRLTCRDRRCLPIDVVSAVPRMDPAVAVAARGALLSVRVEDERGIPFARAGVNLEPPAADAALGGQLFADTDVEGLAVFRTPPGTHRVVAVARRVQDAPSVSVTVPDLLEGEVRDVRVVLPRP